jgi:hypothetical protein
MQDPRVLAERTEASPTVPEGTEQRFAGYGVMGLPFRSGHVLGLRRFGASSIGPGYTSVWLRAPAGEWTFFQDVPAEQACPRYFGPQLRRSYERPIELHWTGPDAFSIEVDGGRAVHWEVTLAAPPSVRVMNALASILPRALWRNAPMLRAMATVARCLLGTGRLALTGRAPSGQHFVANPLVAWTIPSARAVVEGIDVGEPGPLPEQARLGDFGIPQRGLFVIGQAFFEPLDPARHRCELHAEA